MFAGSGPEAGRETGRSIVVGHTHAVYAGLLSLAASGQYAVVRHR